MPLKTIFYIGPSNISKIKGGFYAIILSKFHLRESILNLTIISFKKGVTPLKRAPETERMTLSPASKMRQSNDRKQSMTTGLLLRMRSLLLFI